MLEKCFSKVFECLGVDRAQRMAVAVSGGADSIALLSLASKWARSGPFPGASFITSCVSYLLT